MTNAAAASTAYGRMRRAYRASAVPSSPPSDVGSRSRSSGDSGGGVASLASVEAEGRHPGDDGDVVAMLVDAAVDFEDERAAVESGVGTRDHSLAFVLRSACSERLQDGMR